MRTPWNFDWTVWINSQAGRVKEKFSSFAFFFLPKMEIREAKTNCEKQHFTGVFLRRIFCIKIGNDPIRKKKWTSERKKKSLDEKKKRNKYKHFYISNRINQLFHLAHTWLFLLALTRRVALENRQSWYKPKRIAYDSIKIAPFFPLEFFFLFRFCFARVSFCCFCFAFLPIFFHSILT